METKNKDLLAMLKNGKVKQSDDKKLLIDDFGNPQGYLLKVEDEKHIYKSSEVIPEDKVCIKYECDSFSVCVCVEWD